MKNKLRKIFLIILQTTGAIFLLLIIYLISLHFYFRFDRNLQINSWELFSFTDSTGTTFNFDNPELFELKFKGISNFIITYNQCSEYQYGYEIGSKGTIRVDSYKIVKNCLGFNDAIKKDHEHIKMAFLDIGRYAIRNDTLWLITLNRSKFEFIKK